jgi:hypothetical protein
VHSAPFPSRVRGEAITAGGERVALPGHLVGRRAAAEYPERTPVLIGSPDEVTLAEDFHRR